MPYTYSSLKGLTTNLDPLFSTHASRCTFVAKKSLKASKRYRMQSFFCRYEKLIIFYSFCFQGLWKNSIKVSRLDYFNSSTSNDLMAFQIN